MAANNGRGPDRNRHSEAHPGGYFAATFDADPVGFPGQHNVRKAARTSGKRWDSVGPERADFGHLKTAAVKDAARFARDLPVPGNQRFLDVASRPCELENCWPEVPVRVNSSGVACETWPKPSAVETMGRTP
ncbi:hypothetical protein GCM10023166_19340 [Paeniglutamicibacter cryotolerans]